MSVLKSIAVPDKPALEGLEVKWQDRWDAEGTYRFDRSRPHAGRGNIAGSDSRGETEGGDEEVLARGQGPPGER